MIKKFLLSLFIIQSIALQAMDDSKNQQQNVTPGTLVESVSAVHNWAKEKLEYIEKRLPASEENFSEKMKKRPNKNKKRRNKKRRNKTTAKEDLITIEKKATAGENLITMEKIDTQLRDLWIFFHDFARIRKENAEKKKVFHFDLEKSDCNPRPNDSKNDIDIITESK